MRISSGAKYESFWYALILATGVAVFAGMAFLGLPIDVFVLVTVFGLGLMYISTVETYRLISIIVFALMFINVANYSFLVFNAQGEVVQTTEGRLVAMLRLPLVALAVVYLMSRHARGYISFLRSNWDICTLAIIPFFSALFAFNKADALIYGGWFTFSILAILGLLYRLGLDVPRQQWVERIAWLFLGVNFIMVGFGLVGMRSYGGQVLQGAYANTNIYALGCAVVFASVLVLERLRNLPETSRGLKRTPYVLLVGVGMVTLIPLIFSAKRSAIASVALVMVLYALSATLGTFGKKAGSFMRVLLLVIPLAFLGSHFVPQAGVTLQRFNRVMDDSEKDGSLEDRVGAFQSGMVVLRHYPVFGVGLNNSKVATAALTPGSEGAGFNMHNTVLSVLVETGAVGLILLLITGFRSVYLFATKCFSTFRWSMIMLAVPPVIIGLLETNNTPGQFMFWPFWIALLLPRLTIVKSKASLDMQRTGVRFHQ